MYILRLTKDKIHVRNFESKTNHKWNIQNFSMKVKLELCQYHKLGLTLAIANQAETI